MGRSMDRNWRLIYEQWQASDLSKSAFCRQRNISVQRFCYHSAKFDSASKLIEAAPSTPPQLFAEVICSDSADTLHQTPSSSLTLSLPGGSTIELSTGFNTDILKQVLQLAGQL